jgi:TolB protein
MSGKLSLGLIGLVLGLSIGWAPAFADIVVNVDQAAVQPLPIAIAPFTGAAEGDEIASVVTADLQRSGLFRPIDPAAFAQQAIDFDHKPTFDPWKGLGAQALLVGRVTDGSDGRVMVDFRLYDVYAGQELIGTRLLAPPDSLRGAAHRIADAVYEKLTGEKGYFDTQVVFVAESGPKTKRVTRLARMDQDGHDPTYLTDGSTLVFSPRFSAKAQEITYMALRPTGSTIYLRNLDTGREEVLGRFPGMTMAPSFSPDDSKVVFAAETGGATDLYLLDLASHASHRLTHDLAIDTSPSFSPDGAQIVFNSDRGGAPQLYVMGVDGAGARRISFGKGRYTAPTWSPDGKLIAFVKQDGQQFSIGVMAPDGSGERILTSSYFADEPTWAPNGRVIMFERKLADGESRLWTVDVSGRVLAQEPYPAAGSDPAWSPLMH